MPLIDEKIVDIENKIENSTINPTQVNYTKGNTINIIVIPNENYYFDSDYDDSIPTLKLYDEDGYLELSIKGVLSQESGINAYKISYYFSTDIDYNFSLARIYGYADEITDTTSINIKGNENAIFTENSQQTFYTAIGKRNTIQIKINNGYSTTKTPYIKITTSDGGLNIDFNYNNELQIWEYSEINSLSDITDVEIITNAIKDVDIVENFPLIQIYKVNNDITNELKKLRFQLYYEQNRYDDLGEYIVQYVRYPFEINSENKEKIQLGYYQTELYADIIPKIYHQISFGKKLITGLFNNNSDIENCNIIINIAYFGQINIDSKYINSEIEIICETNILTNESTLLIYSNNILIKTLTSSIGINIPYILINDGYKQIQTNVNINNRSLVNIKNSIVVEQKNKLNNILTDSTYKSLNIINGYAEIELLEYNVKSYMTLQEIELMINILNNGVEFN